MPSSTTTFDRCKPSGSGSALGCAAACCWVTILVLTTHSGLVLTQTTPAPSAESSARVASRRVCKPVLIAEGADAEQALKQLQREEIDGTENRVCEHRACEPVVETSHALAIVQLLESLAHAKQASAWGAPHPRIASV